MAVVSGGLVRFRSRCGCHWKSAHCSFRFHYDLFECAGKVYLYLEATALLQMCRRHKEPAQEVTLDEDCLVEACDNFAAKLQKSSQENAEEPAPQKGKLASGEITVDSLF